MSRPRSSMHGVKGKYNCIDSKEIRLAIHLDSAIKKILVEFRSSSWCRGNLSTRFLFDSRSDAQA